MTITYTWTFHPIETAIIEGDLSDVVKTVHWQFKGVNDETGTEYELIGSETLPEPTPGDYIEFSELTKDIVTTWVLTQISSSKGITLEEAEEELQQIIAKHIDKIDNPKIMLKSAPWES